MLCDGVSGGGVWCREQCHGQQGPSTTLTRRAKCRADDVKALHPLRRPQVHAELMHRMARERRVALGHVGEEQRQGTRQGRRRRERPEDAGGLQKGCRGVGTWRSVTGWLWRSHARLSNTCGGPRWAVGVRRSGAPGPAIPGSARAGCRPSSSSGGTWHARTSVPEDHTNGGKHRVVRGCVSTRERPTPMATRNRRCRVFPPCMRATSLW
jgi:hypothetical protein